MKQSAPSNMFAAFACGTSSSPGAAAQRQPAASLIPSISTTPPHQRRSVTVAPAQLASSTSAPTVSSAHPMRSTAAQSALLARHVAASTKARSSTAGATAAGTGPDMFEGTPALPAASSSPLGGSSAPASASKRRRLSGEQPRGVVEKLDQQPLRLVIVGHNPSDHAWQTGHYYSNPSNRMWPILIKTGIAPPGTTGCEADDAMPASVGVGFTDVGTGHPGTESKDFSSATFEAWGDDFYRRLAQHTGAASDSIGCTCGTCGAPALVAFSGKRQYLELLNRCRPKRTPKVATVPVGPQALLPKGWPLPGSTEVWVCSSTSGASALTNEAREAPYVALAARLARIPWPREVVPACTAYAAAASGAGVGAAPVDAVGAVAGTGDAAANAESLHGQRSKGPS